MLHERIQAWLPRILAGGLLDPDELAPAPAAATLASDGLTLGQLGIHETLVPAPA